MIRLRGDRERSDRGIVARDGRRVVARATRTMDYGYRLEGIGFCWTRSRSRLLYVGGANEALDEMRRLAATGSPA